MVGHDLGDIMHFLKGYSMYMVIDRTYILISLNKDSDCLFVQTVSKLRCGYSNLVKVIH